LDVEVRRNDNMGLLIKIYRKPTKPTHSGS
jgi:hypothetical protein